METRRIRRRIKGCTHPRFGGRGMWKVGVRIVTVGVGGATVGAGGDTKRISTLTGPKVSQDLPPTPNQHLHAQQTPSKDQY